MDYQVFAVSEWEIQRRRMLTWATCIFSFPNSFAKLCERALTPNLPAAKALVTTLPLVAAVAPVNISVPLFPVGSSSSLSLNARIAPRENAKAAATFVCRQSWTSWGVVSRKGFQTPYPTLNTAARITYSGLGKCAWMELHADVISSCEYEGRVKDVACSVPKMGYNLNTFEYQNLDP